MIKKIINKSDRIFLLGKFLKFDDERLNKKVVYINNRVEKKLPRVKKFTDKTFLFIGRIDFKEKDYPTVFKHFKKVIDDYSLSNFSLIFICKAKNQKLEKMLKHYQLIHFSKIYTQFISEKDFETLLLKSHYIILSTQVNSQYGKSKIAGGYGDARAYQIPLLVSQHFAQGYREKNLIRFNQDNLSLILKDILKNKIVA